MADATKKKPNTSRGKKEKPAPKEKKEGPRNKPRPTDARNNRLFNHRSKSESDGNGNELARYNTAVLYIMKENEMKSRILAKLLNNVSLPAITDTLRFPQLGSSVKTAVANPNLAFTLPLDPTNYNGVIFIFKEPLRGFVFNDFGTIAGATSYIGYFAATQSSILSVAVATPAVTLTWTLPAGGETNTTPLAFFKSQGAYSPHGSYLPVGSVVGESGDWVWLDQFDIYSITIQNTHASSAMFWFVDYWFNGVVINAVNSGNVAATVTAVTILKNTYSGSQFDRGYYRFRLSNVTSNAILCVLSVLNIASITGKEHYCQRMVPLLEDNLASVTGMMVSGGSVLISNETPEETKGGKVVAVQPPYGTHWNNFVTSNPTTLITAVTDYYRNVLKDGYYGWVKPSQIDEFNLSDQALTNQNKALVKISYKIDRTEPFLVVAITAPPGVTNSIFNAEVGFNFEFSTENKFFESSDSNIPRSVIPNFFDALQKLPQHFENPNHFSLRNIIQKILGFVPKVVKGIKTGTEIVNKYGPKMINGLELAGELGATALI